jgi:hypothetical protein
MDIVIKHALARQPSRLKAMHMPLSPCTLSVVPFHFLSRALFFLLFVFVPSITHLPNMHLMSRWVDPDENVDNGVLSDDGRDQVSVLRLDALMLMVQVMRGHKAGFRG